MEFPKLKFREAPETLIGTLPSEISQQNGTT